MDDLDVLARDFGYRPQGKSNPMKSDQENRRPARPEQSERDAYLFNDVFGGPPKYISNSNTKSSDFDYDSIFKSNYSRSSENNTSSNKTSSLPMYDKPVYDDDIFDGLPGLKSKSAASSVRFDDNVFTSSSRSKDNAFDHLVGKLGRNSDKRSSSLNTGSKSKGFDDLLAGFGSRGSASDRPVQESVRSAGSNHKTSMKDDHFGALGSTSSPRSSSGIFTDPLEEINKLSKSRSAKAESSSVPIGAFDDLDPLNDLRRPGTSFSPGMDNRKMDGSPSWTATTQSPSTKQQSMNSSFRDSTSNREKNIPVDNFQEPPVFDVPKGSIDYDSFGPAAASLKQSETRFPVDVSPTSQEHMQHSDDIWLTVSEVPLFTGPTSAPPPSRPPPAVPRVTSKSERSSFTSNSRKKVDEFSSAPRYSQSSQRVKPSRPPPKTPPDSKLDELEEFAMGGAQTSVEEPSHFHSDEGIKETSAAAASAAAMKEAMDKAEAKFRHAKEFREREYAKVARSKEFVNMEKDDQEAPETELRENQEKLEREMRQREKDEQEKEQARLERERERARQIERERARQAVERATREARERAASEARFKAEKAAFEKANTEARERAERAAVQRAQAEARERAAVEARERAEKAAAEARRRAAAEVMEKETMEKAAAARAEAEARRRAERAAVERAAAAARERTAAQAQERAAASANVNQQTYDNDLENFFNMGRASSAPRPRANSSDPSDRQVPNKGGSEAPKWTSSSSGAPSNIRKVSSAANFVDDLSSILAATPPSGEFQEVEGETEERRRARLERHQRTQERAAKALAEKNQRDLQAQRDQEERHRIAETLDIEIKRWAAGKEGNLRALLSTLQYVLWPECGWQPVSLTDLITGASVKKVYRKATLCIHPDKVQQKGATLQQKYIAEKVFDLLKEAWNKFTSEELF